MQTLESSVRLSFLWVAQTEGSQRQMSNGLHDEGEDGKTNYVLCRHRNDEPLLPKETKTEKNGNKDVCNNIDTRGDEIQISFLHERHLVQRKAEPPRTKAFCNSHRCTDTHDHLRDHTIIVSSWAVTDSQHHTARASGGVTVTPYPARAIDVAECGVEIVAASVAKAAKTRNVRSREESRLTRGYPLRR